MRILTIGNIDGQIEPLRAVLDRAQTAEVGAIFLVGNIVAGEARRRAYDLHAGNTRLPLELSLALAEGYQADNAMYNAVFDQLEKLNVPVYIVPGEQDAPLTDFSEALQRHQGLSRLWLVHRSAAYLNDGDVVAGFGGRPTADQDDEQLLLHFPSWEVRVSFEYLAAHNPQFQLARRRILLFGSPPLGDQIDLQDGRHEGVQAFNRVIHIYQPHLVCCAGSDERRGVDMIEGVPVVNPGWLSKGSYALIDMDQLTVKLEQLKEAVPQKYVIPNLL